MKKSSGKPSRIQGQAAPSEQRPQQRLMNLRKPYKKKSRKKLIALLLLLLLATSLFFLYNLSKNKHSAKIKSDSTPGIKDMGPDMAAQSSGNDKPNKDSTASSHRKESRNSSIKARPIEKKVYDFGTKLKLDPPPVRD